MKLSQHTADPDRAQGTWIEFDGDGCEFKLASSTRPEFQKALENSRKRLTAHLPKFKRDNFSGDLALSIFESAIAEEGIVDWSGITEEDGVTPMHCTLENRRIVAAVPRIRDWLSEQINDLSNFQKEAIAEDAEELKSVSLVVFDVGTAS